MTLYKSGDPDPQPEAPAHTTPMHAIPPDSSVPVQSDIPKRTVQAKGGEPEPPPVTPTLTAPPDHQDSNEQIKAKVEAVTREGLNQWLVSVGFTPDDLEDTPEIEVGWSGGSSTAVRLQDWVVEDSGLAETSELKFRLAGHDFTSSSTGGKLFWIRIQILPDPRAIDLATEGDWQARHLHEGLWPAETRDQIDRALAEENHRRTLYR